MARFPEPPRPAARQASPPENEAPENRESVYDEPEQPVWQGPPEGVLAGVVPIELVLGRSSSTVVTLSGVRAFPPG